MTRNGSPSLLVPMSVTCAMPSWPICDAVIASRWNRSIIGGVLQLRVQDLDRDALAQLDVGADVHRAHPADREQALDAILVVEHRALRQRARSRGSFHWCKHKTRSARIHAEMPAQAPASEIRQAHALVTLVTTAGAAFGGVHRSDRRRFGTVGGNDLLCATGGAKRSGRMGAVRTPLGATLAVVVAVTVSCHARVRESSPPGSPAAPVPAAVPAPPAAPMAAAASEPVPLGPLPTDVRPTHESLALEIDPESDRFHGTADIALHLYHPRDHFWVHGRGLTVSAATITPSGFPSGTPSGPSPGTSASTPAPAGTAAPAGTPASTATLAARWDEVDPNGVVRVTLPAAVSGRRHAPRRVRGQPTTHSWSACTG